MEDLTFGTVTSIKRKPFNSRKFCLASRDEQEIMTLVPATDYHYLADYFAMDINGVKHLFETKLVKLSIKQQKLRHKMVKISERHHAGDHMLIPPTPVSHRVATQPKLLTFPLGPAEPRDFSLFQNYMKPVDVRLALESYHKFIEQVLLVDLDEIQVTYETQFTDSYSELSITLDEDGIYIVDPIYALLRSDEKVIDRYLFELKRFLSKIRMEPLCGSILSYWHFSHPNQQSLFNVCYQDFTTKMMVTPWIDVFPDLKLIMMPKTLHESIHFKHQILSEHDTTVRLNDFNYGPNLGIKAEFDKLSEIYDLIKEYPYVPEPDRPDFSFDPTFINFIDNTPVTRVDKALIKVSSYDEFKLYREFASIFRVFLPIEAIFDGLLHQFIYHYKDIEVVKRTDFCTSHGFMIEFKNQRILDHNRRIEEHMYYGLVAHLKRRIIRTMMNADDLTLLRGAICTFTITDFEDSAPVNLVVSRPYASSLVTVYKMAGCYKILWKRGGESYISRSGLTNSYWFADIYNDMISIRGDLCDKNLFSCPVNSWNIMLSKSLLPYKDFTPNDYFSSLIMTNEYYTSKSYSFHKLYTDVVIGKARVIPQRQPNVYYDWRFIEPVFCSQPPRKENKIKYEDIFPCYSSMPKMNIYTCKFTGKKMFTNLPNVINERFNLKSWWRNKFTPIRRIIASGYSQMPVPNYDEDVMSNNPKQLVRNIVREGQYMPTHRYDPCTKKIYPRH